MAARQVARVDGTFSAVCNFPRQVALNPQSSTLNTQHSILHPQPSTLNPQPSTLNPQPSTLIPESSNLNSQSSTLDLESPRSVVMSEANAKEAPIKVDSYSWKVTFKFFGRTTTSRRSSTTATPSARCARTAPPSSRCLPASEREGHPNLDLTVLYLP